MPYQKKCEVCRSKFTPQNTLDKYCSWDCAIRADKQKQWDKLGKWKHKNKIKPVSQSQGQRLRLYTKQRKAFLSRPENERCAVIGCTRKANTVEHRRGRVGYADQWARDNSIWLLNDERYFLAVCLQCNQDFENNPELSREYQLSKLTGKKKNPR